MSRDGRNDFHRRRNKGGGIPDRWLNYDAVGRDIEGTRFVPFKTPLDARFFQGNSGLTDDDYFDVRTIISYARDAGKRIGLVIDLTNTDRYYKKTEWKDYGVDYKKINCPGHEINQREDLVQEFMDHVDEYFGRCNDDSLVGVHCTHGLNRTGYVICRYLIDRMHWTADQAINQFEYNRGHPIERGLYKKSLFDAWRRKNEGPNSSSSAETGTILADRIESPPAEAVPLPDKCLVPVPSKDSISLPGDAAGDTN